jgi:hypothetical protein
LKTRSPVAVSFSRITEISMSVDFSWIVGLRCRELMRGPHTWHFEFGAGTSLVTECPWRIIANSGIALGSVDDQQQFGLPVPIDAEAVAHKLLRGRQVTSVEVRPESSDLVLHFDSERRLELFNNSLGYEGWTLNGPDGKQIIAQGGGHLVCFGS